MIEIITVEKEVHNPSNCKHLVIILVIITNNCNLPILTISGSSTYPTLP